MQTTTQANLLKPAKFQSETQNKQPKLIKHYVSKLNHHFNPKANNLTNRLNTNHTNNRQITK